MSHLQLVRFSQGTAVDFSGMIPVTVFRYAHMQPSVSFAPSSTSSGRLKILPAMASMPPVKQVRCSMSGLCLGILPSWALTVPNIKMSLSPTVMGRNNRYFFATVMAFSYILLYCFICPPRSMNCYSCQRTWEYKSGKSLPLVNIRTRNPQGDLE